MYIFEEACATVLAFLKFNATQNDYKHAINTRKWLVTLAPDASELLQLAALCHDLERARVIPFLSKDFKSYDEYKSSHAQLSGEMANDILTKFGFNNEKLQRLREIILNAEFSSNDPEVQLLCDADSISYFDNNVEDYLKRKGINRTQVKMKFMYDRASTRAKMHITEILKSKRSLPDFNRT